MNRTKKHFIAFVFIFLSTLNVLPCDNIFLFETARTTFIHIDKDEKPVVHTAVSLLQQDVQTVYDASLQTTGTFSVRYRGIFLNDEDWGLMPWATKTLAPGSEKGAIGPEAYERIFELLLRLRANTIWPAMHECTVPFLHDWHAREA
jgi:hypothetical protein